MKNFLLLTFFYLGFFSVVHASFDYLGRYPASDSLAGAYVAGDGVESINFNVAGLASDFKNGFSFRYMGLKQDVVSKQVSVIGGSLFFTSASGVSTGLFMDFFDVASIYREYFFSIPFVYSHAAHKGNSISYVALGVALKMFSWSSVSDGSEKLSIRPTVNADIGLRLGVLETFFWGVSVRNLLPVTVSLDLNTSAEKMAPELTSGFLFPFVVSQSLVDKISWYLDFSRQFQFAEYSSKMRYASGMEFSMGNSLFKIRGGLAIDDPDDEAFVFKPAFGFGIGVGKASSYEMDLSYRTSYASQFGFFNFSVKIGFLGKPHTSEYSDVGTGPSADRTEQPADDIAAETPIVTTIEKEKPDKNKIRFSMPSGEYENPFILEMTPQLECMLYLTMDGSDPDLDSYKVQFTGKPIKIKIKKSTVLKILVVTPGIENDTIYTKSYSLLDEGS